MENSNLFLESGPENSKRIVPGKVRAELGAARARVGEGDVAPLPEAERLAQYVGVVECLSISCVLGCLGG